MEKKSPFGEDGKKEDVWLRFLFLRNHLLVVVVPGNHKKVPCFLFWATGLLVLRGFKLMEIRKCIATVVFRELVKSGCMFGFNFFCLKKSTGLESLSGIKHHSISAVTFE